MTTTTIVRDKSTQLIRDGYCVFEQVLTPEMLARVRDASDGLLAAQSAEHFDEQKSTGSMISVYDDPFFADLVAYDPALDALTSLGYPNPRWSSGFVISKPGHSPPLFWHQDWWGWNDPVSYTNIPQQLFLMYYLVDTRIENGCLRVISGSHRKRHRMHDAVPNAHTDELRRATDPSHPAFQPMPEDKAVPVRAGDLVIGDSRLLHGSYANRSDERRTVITLWYHPNFDIAPPRIQAHLSKVQTRAASWSPHARKLIRRLVPTYDGAEEPLEWNRLPGDQLR
jgi:ectoine hydroxylase-related dioxygenase (phytanoyl-CoA dioxygenase family)